MEDQESIFCDLKWWKGRTLTEIRSYFYSTIQIDRNGENILYGRQKDSRHKSIPRYNQRHALPGAAAFPFSQKLETISPNPHTTLLKEVIVSDESQP